MDNNGLARYRIHITGIVQGVGFRPFVYNLATRLGLSGWVLNSSSGVEIEATGPAAVLDDFVQRLRTEAPPLARIENITVTPLPLSHSAGEEALTPSPLPPSPSPAERERGRGWPEGPGEGVRAFRILHSEARPGEFLPISPDVAICEDCLRELFDPQDRRYRYPFINCTNCGPRFTIIRDIPYDRPNTTMAPFVMCPDCQAEYDDPANRRFHAQPNACPVCGPRIEFRAHPDGPSLYGEEALQAARRALADGLVVAVKGLGGFHLACDATRDEPVLRLRERKGRVDKPFALMAFDLATVERFCFVDEAERALLASRQRPIVLLRRRPEAPISPHVAPNNRYLGFMLPYTPLHYLLLEPADGFPPALVMTSGNYSEEPIVTANEEAMARLSALADAFLLHNRDIHARCDDSVVRTFAGATLPIRRSRGYAPDPVRLPFSVRQVLAVGAELKNTFCLTRDRYAFISQHIGDMENYETLRFFEDMVEQLKRTFRVEPEVVAHDMHPGYLSTRYARALADRLPLFPVQHHHAHIAACMAEHGLTGERPVIGVAFDGTGYGTDGAIWGGEFLVADYGSFRRAAHLRYLPLPGGDTAIRRPYRVALAYLWATGVPWTEDLPPVAHAPETERAVLERQLARGVGVVPTSSMGRLFDAVSALAEVRQEVNYEAQAAIELEMLADDGVQETYAFGLEGEEVDPAPVLQAVVADVRAGIPAPAIAAKFHNGVAAMIRDVCLRLRAETGLTEVALSGGVFQNIRLLGKAVRLLEEAGFTVYVHRVVPPNDGGISLGQAVIAGRMGRG